jgi:hypothetical protein
MSLTGLVLLSVAATPLPPPDVWLCLHRLGDDRWEVREAATLELIEAGRRQSWTPAGAVYCRAVVDELLRSNLLDLESSTRLRRVDQSVRTPQTLSDRLTLAGLYYGRTDPRHVHKVEDRTGYGR